LAVVAMNLGSVTVFGGTGLLGRAIVDRLAAAHTTVRVAVRHPETVSDGSADGRGGRLLPIYADVRDEASVGRALQGCDAVVNAVGLYSEKGSETFMAVHELGAENVARQSARAGVKALVHISGIGVDPNSRCRYVKSRAQGEFLVREAFKDATILRPSVLFGPRDRFVNTLIAATRWSPVLALFGAGETRLQPVYVGDVAEAVLRALDTPSSRAKVFELGGPHVYRYRTLLELVLKETGRWRLLMPMPYFAWDALAKILMLLPRPPLTTDAVTLLRQDNVVSDGVLKLADLGIEPTALESVLPLMLKSRG
jgi:uncharacterized protein YbjT (DUF2867 family)